MVSLVAPFPFKEFNMNSRFDIIECSEFLLRTNREHSEVLLGNNPNNYSLCYRDKLDEPFIPIVKLAQLIPNISVYGCCSGHGQRSAYIIFIAEPKHLSTLFKLASELHIYKTEILHVAPLCNIDPELKTSMSNPFMYDTDKRISCIRFKSDNFKVNNAFFKDLEDALSNLIGNNEPFSI